MSKIKNAEYWQEQIMYGEPLAIDTIRQIQKQAIEATVEVVAENAEILVYSTESRYSTDSVSLHNVNGDTATINKAQILALISSNDLKVE